MFSRRIISLVLILVLLTSSVSTVRGEGFALPAALDVIEESAFEGDTSLGDVILPDQIRVIESRAFADSSVGWINLPSSLEYISPDAFENAPYALFDAELGTYAFQWMVDHHFLIFVQAEAPWTDCYAIWWLPVAGVENYTVLTYLDEACENLYRTDEGTQDGAYVYTDVGTQYWFVMEYEQDGQVYRSDPVTVEPLVPMDAPENFTAELTEDGHVLLSFDAVPGATGYSVFYSTTTDEWSPELERIPFEGSPEDWSESWLEIAEGETLFVWVCADNGEGTNKRAFDLVTRFGDVLPMDSLYISTLDLLSEENITDQETLSDIRKYNESIAQYNSLAEMYNASIGDACSAMEALAANMSDFSMDEDDDTLVYNFGEMQVVMDRALAGDELNEVTDFLLSEDGETIIAQNEGEDVFYIHQSGASIYISHTAQAGNHAQGTPRQVRAADSNSSEARLQRFRELLNAILSDWNTLLNTVSTAEARAESMVASLKANSHLPEAAKNLKYAERYLKLIRTISGILALIDMPVAIRNLQEMADRWEEVNKIAAHNHMTELDAFPTRYPYALQVQKDIPVLQGIYIAQGLLSAIQLYADIAALYTMVGTAGLSLPASALMIIVPYALGKIAEIQDRTLYNRIMSLDPKLHSVAYGYVRDENTRKPLSGVVVTDWVNSVITDNNGYYAYPVLPDEAVSLWFVKNGYDKNGYIATVGPYQMAKKDIDLKIRYGYLEGTVKDAVTGEVLSGCIVNYSDGSSASTNSEGYFKIKVPINYENGALIIQGGQLWKLKKVDVTLDEEGAIEDLGIIEREWASGIHGRMVYEDGSPMPNADIRWMRTSASYISWNHTSTDENGDFWAHILPDSYILERHPVHGLGLDYRIKYTRDTVKVDGDGITELPTYSWVNTEGQNCVGVLAYDRWDQWRNPRNFVFSWDGRSVELSASSSTSIGFTCVFPNDTVTIHAEGDVERVSDGVTVHLEWTKEFNVHEQSKVGDFPWILTLPND